MEAKGQRVPKLEAIASRFSGLRPDGEGEMATIRGGVRMDAKCLLLGLEQENVHHRSGCVWLPTSYDLGTVNNLGT